jgi:RNA recognition motif-containing protein
MTAIRAWYGARWNNTCAKGSKELVLNLFSASMEIIHKMTMKIFIANFPFDLSETDICDLFKIFGEITGCKLVKDPDTGKSKGYGFVEFREARSAKLAMKEMNGYRIAGRNIAVTKSTSESTKVHRQINPHLKKTG